MTRGTGSIRTESRRSFRHEKKLSYIEETEDSYSLLQQREIIVTVDAVENIDPNKVKEIIVRIEYAGNILAQSFPTLITSEKVDIGITGCINAEDVNPQFLDEILSNPVLFTVLDCSSSAPAAAPSSMSPNLDKEARKKNSKASNSPISNSKSFVTSSTVLGICNLDIGDLAMGETRIKDTLLLEPDKKVAPPDLVTWVKLPRITVSVSIGDEPLLPNSENKCNNVVGITVESVYNIPDYISEGSVFDANIPVPSLGDKTNSIRFPGGMAVILKDTLCRKKWLNLLHIEGRGARSKHSISPTACDVTSTLPEHVNIENEINKSNKLIQWNTWRNSFMVKKDVHYFCSKIMKYRVWPIEISIPNKSKEILSKDKSAKSDKKSKPVPSASPASSDHFTAFLDLSPLLYPGVTKARVAAQLYTYSQADLVTKCGSEFPVSYSQASVANGKLKTTSERSKASVREPEENKDTPGLPIYNDDGSPTFIVVEVKLHKPFTPKRDPEYIESNLKAQVSLKGAIKKKMTNFTLVHEDFSRSIKDMVSILSEEHQEFSLSLNNSPSNPASEDFDSAFQVFLCKRENFFKIKATLENKIIELINEKYGAIKDYEEKIPEIYVYLVNEMHKITNSYLLAHEGVTNTYFNTNYLQLYAEESIEEGDYESARDYLLLKLSRETCNPDYWLDCAVCCIGLNKYEAAVEAVREALNLNFHHQMGLLIYALLMARLNNGTLAEQAFEVLLANYPNFIEGWMALRLFYSAMNNIEGVFVAKQMATKLKCECKLAKKALPEEASEPEEFYCKTYKHDDSDDASREGKYGIASFRDGISWVEPLSWTISFCSPDNANVRTLILFLKLGFYEYASLSLSQELLSSGANEENLPPFYLYYSAVNLYLQARYEEAISSLQSFVKDYGKDCFIWSLMGHCYYKLQNHAKAISCYEYVMESYNRPDDIHLIYLRMGQYYIQANKFTCAKQVFTTACKYSPTPKLWKGIGLACLRMNDLEEAEIALSEANYLDNTDPETWAYLALTNAMSRRLDLFKCCASEAKKKNLKNLVLQEEIKFYAALHGMNFEEF